MPRIFDNIELPLLPALQQTLEVADRADFCVGYFNMRGWGRLDHFVEKWSGGDGHCCRLLVGMHRSPGEELRAALGLAHQNDGIDNQTALRLKKQLAEEFREQLVLGMPTNEDETCLRRLAHQIKAKKVIVKLYLRHPLHAKLYLLFRPDPINPIVGYLGSSNLTLAGLAGQGELNVDVMDHDACDKLAKWFEERWEDRWCIDISTELVQIIEESWAREELIPPYHIYVKMAYHLSQEARAGLAEFKIPKEFRHKLFEFQSAAVRIAAHHLNKRGGVLIGDVVGLGKTLMATALAKLVQDDHGISTLIICPKNLTKMWQHHAETYGVHAKIVPLTMVAKELPNVPGRFRLVILDESHNLRNRAGNRYRAIQEFIQQTNSKCVLLSATPYNKTYLDLGNQLRLFVGDDRDLGVRPERLFREKGELEFGRLQVPPRSLAAFEKSNYADDWRELMRLFLVRRTRSFIQENYAQADCVSCGHSLRPTENKCPNCSRVRGKNERRYLTFENGQRSSFPTRLPRTVKFQIDNAHGTDQYSRLYADDVVDAINDLELPRYGLGNHVAVSPHSPPTTSEAKIIQDLSRAGKRLKGFCRTNLFKRLESSGHAFLQSVERHILRNFIFLHAIEKELPLPIGPQDAELLDSRFSDDDESVLFTSSWAPGDGHSSSAYRKLQADADYKKRAEEVYSDYAGPHSRRFKWLNSRLFDKSLAKDLRRDIQILLRIKKSCGHWDPSKDSKLVALRKLLLEAHPDEKVLLFTQFADTVRYLESELRQCGLKKVATATGDSADPTTLAWQFSPESNEKRSQVSPEEELRVLLSTDVLSEGQNLQDCSIVVNYDLPWAIIRLVQRAGRVDRIGQKAQTIICYSFLPADGVERIIRLRMRVRQRLRENAEVVGTDEAFFEDDSSQQTFRDLFTEKAGILDGDADTEIDLASYAYQIWKNAISAEPSLQKIIPDLPAVVFATKATQPTDKELPGVLVYLRTAEGTDALAWMDRDGNSVTESQFAILKAAECLPETPALPRQEDHHVLVRKAAEMIIKEEKSVGGQLGRPSGARFRTYERLKRFADQIKNTLFASSELPKVIDDIYRYPLRHLAVEKLNRQLRSGISDEDLAELVIALRDDDQLCLIHEDEQTQEPRIICSLGLRQV